MLTQAFVILLVSLSRTITRIISAHLVCIHPAAFSKFGGDGTKDFEPLLVTFRDIHPVKPYLLQNFLKTLPRTAAAENRMRCLCRNPLPWGQHTVIYPGIGIKIRFWIVRDKTLAAHIRARTVNRYATLLEVKHERLIIFSMLGRISYRNQTEKALAAHGMPTISHIRNPAYAILQV